MNLHFDSISFSTRSALCGKGNLEPASVLQFRQTKSVIVDYLGHGIRPTTTPGNLQYGGHHVPKLRDGNSVVVRVWNAKSKCAFISFRGCVIAWSNATCYSLIKIPAINASRFKLLQLTKRIWFSCGLQKWVKYL